MQNAITLEKKIMEKPKKRNPKVNSEVRIVKKADPKKLKELNERKKQYGKTWTHHNS